MASTKTILASLEWAKRFIYNRQLSIGDFKEPLITSANTVLQTILGKPFKWQFNRVISGFVATASQQDYLLLYAWPASQALTAGTLVVDAAGNSQKVTTPGTTNSTIPSFNGTLNGTTTDNTVTWTNVGKIPNASASYNFGWIENASVQDPTSSKWVQIENKVDLALDAATSRPQFIAAELLGSLGIFQIDARTGQGVSRYDHDAAERSIDYEFESDVEPAARRSRVRLPDGPVILRVRVRG